MVRRSRSPHPEAAAVTVANVPHVTVHVTAHVARRCYSLEDLLTAEQVAEGAGVSSTRVRQLAAKGVIGYKFGTVYIYTPDDLGHVMGQRRRRNGAV